MRRRFTPVAFLRTWVTLFFVAFAYQTPLFAQIKGQSETEKALAFERELAADAIKLLDRQILEPPNRRIPFTLREQVKCVALFPRVVKAGVIVAAKRGHGLVSCRDRQSGKWGAPAFFNITAASVGIQAGISEASYIFLFMNNKAVEGLLSEKVSLGSDISVAAGPVGAAADVRRLPAVLTYVRTEGLFAGVNLEGVNLTFATTSNGRFYGWDDAKEVLLEGRPVPEVLKAFHEALEKFISKSGDASEP